MFVCVVVFNIQTWKLEIQGIETGGTVKLIKCSYISRSNQIELQSREEPPISVQPSNSVEPVSVYVVIGT